MSAHHQHLHLHFRSREFVEGFFDLLHGAAQSSFKAECLIETQINLGRDQFGKNAGVGVDFTLDPVNLGAGGCEAINGHHPPAKCFEQSRQVGADGGVACDIFLVLAQQEILFRAPCAQKLVLDVFQCGLQISHFGKRGLIGITHIACIDRKPDQRAHAERGQSNER
ncbi:hypothetical protein GGQ68_003955 [Sagittula marina]|uniref:Uncharacterized protein n=1 Tax=Sagittula marina TaxID=943940 RepID=A0A7W6DR44_9RHOB|nr:hypothetical protein [Sagittula marina]MBB3987608.1 hypothetical protein [Sagittula marina]